jgi:hypothetical protein
MLCKIVHLNFALHRNARGRFAAVGNGLEGIFSFEALWHG